MKKRLLACLLTAAMLVSLFPLPALAAEAERPEWMVTAFDPLDEDIAAQTVPQGGEPVLPDSLTTRAYVIEDDTAVILPPEGLEQESEQPQADGPEAAENNQPPVDGQEGPEDEQLPPDNTEEPPAPGEALTETMMENDPEPAEKREPDIQPAAYEVAGEVELPVIFVTVTAAEQTDLQRVQTMIDTLPAPEDITEGNAEEVGVQFDAVHAEILTLMEQTGAAAPSELLTLDRYHASEDALSALAGTPVPEVPLSLSTQAEGTAITETSTEADIQTAFGSESITVSRDTITLTDDIALSSPVVFASGTWTLTLRDRRFCFAGGRAGTG